MNTNPWNDLAGIFEIPEFSHGTRPIANTTAKFEAKSIGGDDIPSTFFMSGSKGYTDYPILETTGALT